MGQYSNQKWVVRYGREDIGAFDDMDEVRWAIESDMRSHWGDESRRTAFDYKVTVEG